MSLADVSAIVWAVRPWNPPRNAMMTGRPVKICLTREEVFYCHRGRHPVLMKIRTGVTKQGAITAMDFESYLDGGAYGSYGVASTYYTGALQTVTYEIPSYRFKGARAFTNKPPCGPKLGHGTPQPRFALEVQLDKIAEELKLDPAEMRLKHLVKPNTITANWLRVGTIGLGECIEKVVAGSRWKERYGKLPYGRGIGLACSSYITGAGVAIYWNEMPHSGVQIKCDRGGGVTVFCGSTEIGQGSDTVLALIVAEILGIEPADIAVVTADTDLTPVDLGSYSSRVTLMTGQAAIQAAERARAQIAEAVAAKLNASPERIVFVKGRVFDVENPEPGLSFAEAVVVAESRFGTIGSVGSYAPPKPPGKYRGAGVGPSAAYSYSAAVAEVEVDPETGIVRVPTIWIAHDIGRSINPALKHTCTERMHDSSPRSVRHVGCHYQDVRRRAPDAEFLLLRGYSRPAGPRAPHIRAIRARPAVSSAVSRAENTKECRKSSIAQSRVRAGGSYLFGYPVSKEPGACRSH